MVAMAPDSLSRIALAAIDPRVVVVSVATVLAWGVLLSLAPLGEAFRVNVVSALRQDGRRSSGGDPPSAARRAHRLADRAERRAAGRRRAAGADVRQRPAGRSRVSPPTGVLSFRVALPGSRYPNRRSVQRVCAAAADRARRRCPGVTGAAGVSHVPYDHVPNWGGPYLSQPGAGRVHRAAGRLSRDHAGADRDCSASAWSRAARSPRLDDVRSQPVVIVDERLAARTWPGRSAVGQRLGVDPFVTGKPADVGDGRSAWCGTSAIAARSRKCASRFTSRSARCSAIRRCSSSAPAADPAALAASGAPGDRAARRAAADLRRAPAGRLRDRRAGDAPLHDDPGGAVRGRRAGAGLGRRLRRRRLRGDRAAPRVRRPPGAGRARRPGGRRWCCARARGWPRRGWRSAGWPPRWSRWLLRGQLFGVGPWDVVTYAAAVPILAVVAIVACLLPLRRATATSPVEALRAD